MTIDRRRYKRFLADDNTYAALGRDYLKVGKVHNISINGLSFEYLNNKLDSSEGVLQLSLFVTNNGFHQSGIQCKVIYDYPIRYENSNAFGNIQKNRCGVCFLSLTQALKERLNIFIQQYTNEKG